MRDWIIKDLGWKLFSLTLAVAIWVTVKTLSGDMPETHPVSPMGVSQSVTFTNLPVLVVSSAADVREFKVKPDAIAVTVRGRPDVIAALHQKEIHVTVDLTDVESARDLRERVDVSTPPDVTFISANPREVEVVVPPKRN